MKKDGSTYGAFQAMVTEFHTEKRPYVASDLQFNGSHVKLYVSANGTFDLTSPSKHGHGVESFTNTGYQTGFGGDAIVYVAGDYGQNVIAVDIPGSDTWDNARRYNYKLVHLNELWIRRGNTDLYDGYTGLRGGVDGVDDGGTLPWEREYFRSPLTYFQGVDAFNFLDADLATDSYVYNPYYNNQNTQTGNANPNAILPALGGWTGVAIGGGAQGKVTLGKSTFVVDGQGADIWDTSDAFYFVYKSSPATVRSPRRHTLCRRWTRGRRRAS